MTIALLLIVFFMILPASRKAFLLALAIIDDLMAIVVIAIFYTADLSVLALALGGLGVAALAILNLLDVRRPSFYLIAGLFTCSDISSTPIHRRAFATG